MTSRDDVRAEVRQFLTTRRAKLSPEQAGPARQLDLDSGPGARSNLRLRHLSKDPPVPIQPKQPTANGPAEWFTGDVWIDPIARGEAPSRAPDHFMSHLSITEAVPGDERPEANWGEHVTDDEVAAAPATNS